MDKLKKQLLQLVNNSELPLEAVYYVIKDLYRDVVEVYDKMLQEQEENLKNEPD